jgi:hypothetical protein
MHMDERLRSGGGPNGVEMDVGAGGFIKQTIEKDRHNPTIWQSSATAIFHIQFLNPNFEKYTGVPPPETPVMAMAYKKHGFPYYDIYDEVSMGISGDIEGSGSVTETGIDRPPTMMRVKAVAQVYEMLHNPFVLLNHFSERIGFRTLRDTEREMRERFGDIAIQRAIDCGSICGSATCAS